MSKADLIRKHVIEIHLKPNKLLGKSELTLRSGDIHKELSLKSNLPNVCQAMSGHKLENEASVKLIRREPASDGANVFFTYRLVRAGDSQKPLCLADTFPFLIKTKISRFFPSGEFPNHKSEWFDLVVNIPKLKGNHKSHEENLQSELNALLWLHENPRSGPSGRGLTAAVRIAPFGHSQKAKIIEVELFDPAVGSEKIFGKASVRSDLIKQIDSYRPDRIWPLDEETVNVFQMALFNQKENFAQSTSDPSLMENLELEPVVYALKQTQIRAQQSLFRKRLMTTYGPACQLSHTSQIDALEAAHIVPYKFGLPDRDSIGNGLLLRSDIHKLFDRFLISMNPNTGVFVISEGISEEYRFIQGMVFPSMVRHTNAAWHYKQFKKRNGI